jgi:8-oxo-dGTP pyrophosphatase MutT (NUDIX family)
MEKWLAGLREKLAEPKPGLAAQAAMAPAPRPAAKLWIEVEGTSLKAGVMILLYPRAGRPHLVLIRRTSTVLHHKDQISFPGGQIEKGEDFVRAALRETTEEVGAPAGMIEVIGSLTPLYIPPSNFCVFPVVGFSRKTPSFRPDPVEVAEIIEVPVAHLLNPGHIRTETWTINGREVRVPFYEFRRHKVWGATAMIMAEFLEILRPVIGS